MLAVTTEKPSVQRIVEHLRIRTSWMFPVRTCDIAVITENRLALPRVVAAHGDGRPACQRRSQPSLRLRPARERNRPS